MISPFLMAIAFSVLAGYNTLVAAQTDYVEVPPGTKLCDPGEDVYGYYLVKSKMKPDGTQDVEYYRFLPAQDPKTGRHQVERQEIGFSAAWIKRHPQYKDKLEVIDPHTGQADEFPYAPCKQQ
jgi:hypothetical protein